MKSEDFVNIKAITFPNTALTDKDRVHYGFSMDKWRFELSKENGEMAEVNWIKVFMNDKFIAYIKQSVCNIYLK